MLPINKIQDCRAAVRQPTNKPMLPINKTRPPKNGLAANKQTDATDQQNLGLPSIY
jgi:hypothetical protein